MPVVFDEVVGNVDGGSRGSGGGGSSSGSSGAAPVERDATAFNRTRATLRLIDHRQSRLRAT